MTKLVTQFIARQAILDANKQIFAYKLLYRDSDNNAFPVGVSPITLALASGFAVTAMLLTKTTHPPAGANPILIMLAGEGWSFLVALVLIGAVLLVLVGKLCWL